MVPASELDTRGDDSLSIFGLEHQLGRLCSCLAVAMLLNGVRLITKLY